MAVQQNERVKVRARIFGICHRVWLMWLVYINNKLTTCILFANCVAICFDPEVRHQTLNLGYKDESLLSGISLSKTVLSDFLLRVTQVCTGFVTWICRFVDPNWSLKCMWVCVSWSCLFCSNYEFKTTLFTFHNICIFHYYLVRQPDKEKVMLHAMKIAFEQIPNPFTSTALYGYKL